MRRGKHGGGFTEDDYYDQYGDDDDYYYDEEEEEEYEDGAYSYNDGGGYAGGDAGVQQGAGSDAQRQSGQLANRAPTAELNVLKPARAQPAHKQQNQWPSTPHGLTNGRGSDASGFDSTPSPDAVAGKGGRQNFQLVANAKPKRQQGKGTPSGKGVRDPGGTPKTGTNGEHLSGGLGRMTIGSTAEKKQQPSPRHVVRPIAEYVPDPALVELVSQRRKPGASPSSSDPQMGDFPCIVVMGHVDAGKSTLTGRLLFECGAVTQKRVSQCAHESARIGRSDAQWAFLMDERAEEREHGVTVDVALATLDTSAFSGQRIVLLDAPGHADFVPNFIGGASQADAAALVVDASKGGFESGFQKCGQTREHIRLARCLGVEQLIVVMSKMDTVDYSASRAAEIRSMLEPFLDGCGYKRQSVQWVPVSAMRGQNLTAAPSDEKFRWYDGPCLVAAFNGIDTPARLTHLPFRMPIADVLPKSRTLGAVAAAGRIESGVVRPGMKILLQSGSHEGTIKAIEHDGQLVAAAGAGMTVDIGLSDIGEASLYRGAVLCHADYPVPSCTVVEMRIVVLDIAFPILQGQAAVFHCHVLNEAAHISKLKAIVASARADAEIKKKNPRTLKSHAHAIVEVKLDRPVCVERFRDIGSLGRVALRDKGETIAIGIVTDILQ